MTTPAALRPVSKDQHRNGRQLIHVRLSRDVVKAIRHLAIDWECDMAGAIERLTREHIARGAATSDTPVSEPLTDVESA